MFLLPTLLYVENSVKIKKKKATYPQPLVTDRPNAAREVIGRAYYVSAGRVEVHRHHARVGTDERPFAFH